MAQHNKDSETALPCFSSIKPDVKQAVYDASFVHAVQNSFGNDNVHPHRQQLSYTVAFPGVYYIDGVLTADECQALCLSCDQCDELKFWSSSGREDESARAFRDADTVEVKSEMLSEIIWSKMNHIVPTKKVIVTDDECGVDFERELVGDWLSISLNYDFLFAKYPSGGSFAPHTDGRAIHSFNTRSFYSVIIFLNDIPFDCGGGTRFYSSSAVRNLKRSQDSAQRWTSDPSLAIGEVAAVAGRMLIFHQSLVHEGVPPTFPHVKYIIRSDIMYTRTPPICDSTTDREAYRIFKLAEDIAESGCADEAIPLFRKALKMSPGLARVMGQG